MTIVLDLPSRRTRNFIPADFKVTTWETLKVYFDELLAAPLDTVEEVEAWLLKSSELEYVLTEDKAWRYIKMTCDTENQAIKEHFQLFVTDIMPHLSKAGNELQKRLYHSEGFKGLDPDKYLILTRNLIKNIELFREENIPLETEVRQRSREFDEISGSLSIEENGQKITLQMAAALLEDGNRAERERVWKKITYTRYEKREDLDQLFADLVGLRHQIAQNAGFSNYSAYMFKRLGRFDYSREDCEQFHTSIEKVVTPMLIKISQSRRQRLGVDVLRHWDVAVDEFGEGKLEPFSDTDELINITQKIFTRLDTSFGAMIEAMKGLGTLDLDSRLGKAPGGYNYGLPETGAPFIFMNAVGSQRDMTTMLHEGGHAIHSFLINKLELSEFTRLPSEVAELASMSMELMALDHYDVIYPEERPRLRAQREQIMMAINILPWIATIDAFQFWVYDHPDCTPQDRCDAFVRLYKRFHGDYISWEGYEEALETYWHRQGHVFEVPFYYIEYAMAQLGALAVWRNTRSDHKKGLEAYQRALAMGYTRPIPEMYAAADVKFDFSEEYVRELMDFLADELEKIEAKM